MPRQLGEAVAWFHLPVRYTEVLFTTHRTSRSRSLKWIFFVLSVCLFGFRLIAESGLRHWPTVLQDLVFPSQTRCYCSWISFSISWKPGPTRRMSTSCQDSSVRRWRDCTSLRSVERLQWLQGYKDDVHLGPKDLDEKVPELHVPLLGAELTVLTQVKQMSSDALVTRSV